MRKGEAVYRAGDAGTCAFVVLEGVLGHVFQDPVSGAEIEVRVVRVRCARAPGS